MMNLTIALFTVALLLIIWVFCTNGYKYKTNLQANFIPKSSLELQIDDREMAPESKGYLRANFIPNNVANVYVPGRGGNWTPWRHEHGNTYYYWYDAPHKTPGFECLDACYHRYDRVGCTNACRNLFNV